jgi:hypothetical protein
VANLQDERFSFDVAKFPQPLPERLEKWRCRRWSARTRVPDLRDLGRLLRLGGEWRGDKAASESSDERPPIHYSIT